MSSIGLNPLLIDAVPRDVPDRGRTCLYLNDRLFLEVVQDLGRLRWLNKRGSRRD